MSIYKKIGALTGLIIISLCACQQAGPQSDYPFKPVSFTDVNITDDFWLPRMETNRLVTIPFAMQQNEETGRVDNFRIAGDLIKGRYRGERYNDTDVYKVMEGAAYTLLLHPDPDLEKRLDDLIAVIGAAQEEDGYLFTPRTASPDESPIGIGDSRWINLAVSHELYNAGHMYEAAVAHFQATGKRNFLDIAVKNADLLLRTFGPDKIRNAPGHQEIEVGLVKLYRVTGNNNYLRLAQYFLDQRGKDLELKIYPPGHRFSIYNDPIQIQAHQPVLEQSEAVGHAVRATYMFSAMADVAALTGSGEYTRAIDRLWENVVSKKLALTGGLGAHHDRERLGANYELPNLRAYNETCAAIGSVFWNHRLFLLHGDGKYIDVLERTLYNGVIVGVSLEGDTFFYPNPLESDGKFLFNKGAAGRQPWFGTACCPGNIARFLPSMPGYIYAQGRDGLYINLFVNSRVEAEMGDHKLILSQTTAYPWEGEIQLEVEPAQPMEFTVYVRIPGWARNQPVPSDLYTYLGRTDHNPHITVNGQPFIFTLSKGYAPIRRRWQSGDRLVLSLPMPVRKVVSHTAVKDNAGKVALERGPLVYCAEGVDNGGVARNLAISEQETSSTAFAVEFRPELLKGVVVVKTMGHVREETSLCKQEITLIPYFAWAHRGVGEMAVWLHHIPEKSDK